MASSCDKWYIFKKEVYQTAHERAKSFAGFLKEWAGVTSSPSGYLTYFSFYSVQTNFTFTKYSSNRCVTYMYVTICPMLQGILFDLDFNTNIYLIYKILNFFLTNRWTESCITHNLGIFYYLFSVIMMLIMTSSLEHIFVSLINRNEICSLLHSCVIYSFNKAGWKGRKAELAVDKECLLS